MSKFKKWLLGVSIVISIAISGAFQSDFFEIAKQIDIYTTMFKELNMLYVDEINPAELTQKSMNHMLQSLDPYTVYYDEQGIEDARMAQDSDFGSIGAQLVFKNNGLIVKELLKDAPAEKAGIITGDKIVKIGDILLKDYSERGAAALLNGAPNSSVNIVIERQNKQLNFAVLRKKMDVSPVPYYAMVTPEVGYIAFAKFTETASTDMKKAFLDLKEQGMKKLIIDVRSNPGGLLHEAVNVTNFFIPKDKIVVTTKGKIQKFNQTYKTTKEPLDLEIPIAVLINNHSASASEILAGSLQDYDRAVVIGERSFGKGLVQQYRELSYGTQMKLTISKYYTPSGRCIQELDYTNRKKDGTVPKFSDAGREKYKTANGRTVYGGGGVLPDVDLKKVETTKTTEVLLASDAFFNYATNYYFNNKTIGEASKFNLKESDFSDFKNYVAQHQADFETETEIGFKKALNNSKTDHLNGTIEKSYNGVLDAIHAEKIKEIEKNKEEILAKLTEEIVKRYYFMEGAYLQKAHFDATISQASALLNDASAYTKLLK